MKNFRATRMASVEEQAEIAKETQKSGSRFLEVDREL